MNYIQITLEVFVIIFLIVAIRQIGDLINKLDPKKPMHEPLSPNERKERGLWHEFTLWKESTNQHINSLNLKIWKLENPPKFKLTDSVTRIDSGAYYGNYIVSGVEVLNIKTGWEYTLISTSGETLKSIPQAWLMLKIK